MLFGEPLHAGRQVELLEVRHGLRDDAEGERDGAALAVRVDAEARQVAVLVGDVEVAGVVEVLELLGRAAADASSRTASRAASSSGWASAIGVEIAVDPADRRLADLQVDVGGAELDGTQEKTVQIHRLDRGIGRIGRFL